MGVRGSKVRRVDYKTPTTIYKINKPQGYNLQHREYSQYFITFVLCVISENTESLCNTHVANIIL